MTFFSNKANPWLYKKKTKKMQQIFVGRNGWLQFDRMINNSTISAQIRTTRGTSEEAPGCQMGG